MTASENPLAKRTSFTYDADGRQIAVQDANGRLNTSVYDAAGRTVAEINALGNRTTTMYDGIGNTTALIDARGNRHSFLYDDAGRETALIDPKFKGGPSATPLRITRCMPSRKTSRNTRANT